MRLQDYFRQKQPYIILLNKKCLDQKLIFKNFNTEVSKTR
jgi:hypothetical protein